MNPDEPQPNESEGVDLEDADPSESIRKSARNHWFLWGGLLFGPVVGVLIATLFSYKWGQWVVPAWLIGSLISGVVAAWGWSGVAGKTQKRILWTILMMHLTIPVSLIAAGASMCCGTMRSR